MKNMLGYNMIHSMNLNRHHKQYKYFLKLKREQSNLYTQRRNMPYIEVEPFQCGWLCSVAIKPSYLTREGLLQAIDIGYSFTNIYSVRDVKNIRKGLTQIFIGKIEMNYFPIVNRIYPKQFESFEPNIKKWFVEQICDKTLKKYYQINVSRNWLKLRVRPNIFTYIQQINPDVESRIKEIDEIFMQNCYWEKFCRSRGHRDYNINLRQDFKNQLNKFNFGIIDNIENNKFKLGWD